MDTQLLLLAALLLLPLLALLLVQQHGAVGKGKNGCRLPPGPLAVPVIGNLLWLRHSSSDVEPLLRRLVARYGPVVSLRVGSRLSIFVADRRIAHAALVERGAALADRPAVTRELLGENGNTISRSSYGTMWRLLRRNLVAETLHPSRVRLFAPARAWVRRVLVDKLQESGEAQAAPVMEAFRYAMFCLLVLMCFGERLDEPAVRAIAVVQRDWLMFVANNTSVSAFWPAMTKHLFRGRLQIGFDVRRRQKQLFVPLIDARREHKKQLSRGGDAAASKKETTFGHSYVDTLLDITLPDEGGRSLTDDEMAKLCSEFLTAGTDTTSTALQWIMAELVKNPAIQEKLYGEIKATCRDEQEEVSEEDTHKMPYLKAVVLEGLRRHPPAHFLLAHKAAEDIEVGGYLIPKGATVNFTVAEMGRDEREWERPMEFVPERFLAGGDGDGVDVTGSREIKMMPFGVGRRICAGLGIAILHLEYFVANLVREFEWKVVPGDEVDLAEKREFTTVMKKPLRAQLVRRTTN
ncbi:cytochrome P450 89A2-like [Phragmites australis]|uniref:cytochrome P450 89A2-like n=1 Tax=Phragmites australis TaxID=29695 RepID=UPI002D79C7A9|nr:cytochrome P450 89A2-like [Phragmites australis]